MAAFPTSPCNACQKPMIWAVTRLGKDIPLNAQPDANGNIRLVDRGSLGPLAEVLSVAQQFGRQGTLYTTHFTNCPRADRFRRQR